MPDLNVVVLAGNLTRDPEVRYAPSGDAVGDLHMAVNRKYRSRDGQDREETCFVAVSVWGRQAETCGQYLRKGSPILIEGRLQYDQWEKDGQKQSRLRVRANRVQFLGSGSGRRDQDDSAAYNQDSGPSAPPPADSTPPPPAPSGPAADDDNLPF